MYFSYCPDDGFELFKTAKEAKKCAEKHLDHFADAAASDGWGEEVGRICWGEVKEVVKQTTTKKARRSSGFDEMWEFALRSVHNVTPVVELPADEDDEDEEL